MTDLQGDDVRIVQAAIDAAAELPPFREFAVRHLSRSTFDASYLEWLDEQAELGARGEEWSERLRVRRRALADFVDVPLIDIVAECRAAEWSIRIHPASARVVHWETYTLP